jgi:hypothetical protein
MFTGDFVVHWKFSFYQKVCFLYWQFSLQIILFLMEIYIFLIKIHYFSNWNLKKKSYEEKIIFILLVIRLNCCLFIWMAHDAILRFPFIQNKNKPNRFSIIESSYVRFNTLFFPVLSGSSRMLTLPRSIQWKGFVDSFIIVPLVVIFVKKETKDKSRCLNVYFLAIYFTLRKRHLQAINNFDKEFAQ